MNFLQILATALTLGATLGGTLATFFAVRQRTLVALLREANDDYKDRVNQLEEDGKRKDAELLKLHDSIKQLQREKRLPLDELQQTIVKYHAYQMDSIDKLVVMIHDLVAVQQETNKEHAK